MSGNISDQTTNFSNVSVEGLLAANRFASTGTITGALITGSDLSSTNTVRGLVGLIGPASGTNAATAITRIAKGSISVVTMTCTANGSTTTAATVAGITTADVVFVTAPSSMSSGIALTAWASGNSQITLNFSNASTAQQVVAGPLTVLYGAIRS